MRIVQLLVFGLPVAGLSIIAPAMSAPFDAASLRSLGSADRMVQEVGYGVYRHYGSSYAARRCKGSPAEC